MLDVAIFCLVVGISDGDTLTVRCGTDVYKQLKVRISAIDAPEKSQSWGQRSRQHLANLCYQTKAKLNIRSIDRYGRSIADVECQGKDAGTEQLRAGYAWFYVKYGKGYEHLAGVEANARARRQGLWQDRLQAAPWDWRRLQKR